MVGRCAGGMHLSLAHVLFQTIFLLNNGCHLKEMVYFFYIFIEEGDAILSSTYLSDYLKFILSWALHSRPELLVMVN